MHETYEALLRDMQQVAHTPRLSTMDWYAIRQVNHQQYVLSDVKVSGVQADGKGTIVRPLQLSQSSSSVTKGPNQHACTHPTQCSLPWEVEYSKQQPRKNKSCVFVFYTFMSASSWPRARYAPKLVYCILFVCLVQAHARSWNAAFASDQRLGGRSILRDFAALRLSMHV
jgi:hypothetical protein